MIRLKKQRICRVIGMIAITGMFACDNPGEGSGGSETAGYQRVYFTKVVDGMIDVSPGDVNVDNINRTIIFPFGVSLSGSQKPEDFSVDILIDNENLPEGTVALKKEEYTLLVAGKNSVSTLHVTGGKMSVLLQLILSEEVLNNHVSEILAIHMRMENLSRYELNASLSETTILFNVDKFLGAEQDVTAKYLKNAVTPFAQTDDSPAKGQCEEETYGTPVEWIITDNVKIYGSGFGGLDARCWDNRDWLSINNWSRPGTPIRNGKIYQTMTLPAGDYKLVIVSEQIDPVDSQSLAAFAVNKGNVLFDYTEAVTADESLLASERLTSPGTYTLEFVLETARTVALGLVADIAANSSWRGSTFTFKSVAMTYRASVFN